MLKLKLIHFSKRALKAGFPTLEEKIKLKLENVILGASQSTRLILFNQHKLLQ